MCLMSMLRFWTCCIGLVSIFGSVYQLSIVLYILNTDAAGFINVGVDAVIASGTLRASHAATMPGPFRPLQEHAGNGRVLHYN